MDPYLQNEVFKYKVVVVVGCGQLNVFDDQLVNHDVVRNYGLLKIMKTFLNKFTIAFGRSVLCVLESVPEVTGSIRLLLQRSPHRQRALPYLHSLRPRCRHTQELGTKAFPLNCEVHL